MSCVGIDTANARLVRRGQSQCNDGNHDLTVNDSPHPHASFTFGLLNVNLELTQQVRWHGISSVRGMSAP